ncbi:hypothetical protein RB25_13210 [Herbaspirillum rubrisubalbicans]|nr:hypothetical protein RB25_13210 [Herbaspirillum rubrisubalbicans]
MRTVHRSSLLADEPVVLAISNNPYEAFFAEVHTGNEQLVGTDDVKQARSCGCRKMRIEIECDGDFRVTDLQVREMHDIPPDQQVLIIRLDPIPAMSGGMSGKRLGADARKYLFAGEEADPVAILLEHLACEEKVATCPFVGAVQMDIVLPEGEFLLMQYQLRVGKAEFSRAIEQPADMIRMSMGQKDCIDLGRQHAGPSEIVLQAAAPLLETSRARVDQHGSLRAADQVAIDMDGRGVGHAGILL